MCLGNRSENKCKMSWWRWLLNRWYAWWICFSRQLSSGSGHTPLAQQKRLKKKKCSGTLLPLTVWQKKSSNQNLQIAHCHCIIQLKIWAIQRLVAYVTFKPDRQDDRPVLAWNNPKLKAEMFSIDRNCINWRFKENTELKCSKQGWQPLEFCSLAA